MVLTDTSRTTFGVAGKMVDFLDVSLSLERAVAQGGIIDFEQFTSIVASVCFAVVSTTLAQFPLIATTVRQVFENINLSHERGGICCDSIIVFGKSSSFYHQRESFSSKSLSRRDGRI